MTVVDDMRLGLLDVAVAACRAGMDALFERRERTRTVALKGERLDIVTDADLASEEAVVSVIRTRRPDDSVVSEEGSTHDGQSGVRWLVDPLDSTANYARDIPIYSVSVAAQDASGLLAGAVGDPERNVIYSSQRGDQSVRIDEVAKSASHATELDKALALFGLGPRSTRDHPRTALVPATLLQLFGKVRSPGSPALGLAWVAVGLADLAYYEMDFGDWDVAAGRLLCHEAGLKVLCAAPVADGLSRRLVAGVPEFVDAVAVELFPELQHHE